MARGFTVSEESISHAVTIAGTESTIVYLQVDINDPEAGEDGIRGTYTSNGISTAVRNDISPLSTEVRVNFKAPDEIGPGTYNDTLTIGFCGDPLCTTFTGTTLEIPVTYMVTLGTMPTLTLGNADIEISRLPWDPGTPPISVVSVLSSAETRFNPVIKLTPTSTTITSADFTVNAGQMQIHLGFKAATELTAGTHTDTVAVSACIDLACKYPLTVTPSVIDVTYMLSNTVPGPKGYTVRKSAQMATDVAWSDVKDVLYLSVPQDSPNYGGHVLEFEPVAEAAGDSLVVGFAPGLLALSDDGSKLYVAEKGGDSIQRFTASPLAADVMISLGIDPEPPGTVEFRVSEMQVAPGQPDVLAVRRFNDQCCSDGRGIVIYDNAAARPNIATMLPTLDHGYFTWSPDGTLLYANRGILAVDAAGVSFLNTLPNSFGRLYPANGLLYSDVGDIVDPMASVDFFQSAGFKRVGMVDEAAGRAYFFTQDANYRSYIELFDLQSRQAVGTALLPKLGDGVYPTRAVRYGTDGIAVVTNTNDLYLVHGPLLAAP